MTAKLDFLTSRKFWALVLIAIINIVRAYGLISEEVATSLITFLYGFVTVNVATKVVTGISKIG